MFSKIKLSCHGMVFLLALLLGTSTWAKEEAKNEITVGIAAGTQAEIWQTVQKVAMRKYGLKVVVVPLSEYDSLDKALNNGDLDANAFQHGLYLKEEIKNHHYNLKPVAKTFIHPIALYSIRIRDLNEFKAGDIIGLGVDPIITARALVLLQQGGLITLKTADPTQGMTIADIKSNPKDLKFITMDPAELVDKLNAGKISAAVLNNNYAYGAGFKLSGALIVENHKNGTPYVDLIVVRENEENLEKVKELVAAFQSPEVKAAAEKIYGSDTVIAW